MGRNALGIPIALIGGNEYFKGYDTNYWEGTSTRYLMAIGAMSPDGNPAAWATPGASIHVVAPGENAMTTDVTGANGYVDGDYYSFSGTCGSTPVASGVIALMLDANAGLGWRDVQEILAYSARQTGTQLSEWDYNGADNWNGGGLHVSHRYGFGLIDAHAAVRLAETWEAVSTSANERSVSASSARSVAITDNGLASDTIEISGGIEIDHVEVDLNVSHTWIGDLVVTLVSPDGTESILVNRPGKDPDNPVDIGAGSDNFVYTVSSTHHWGEVGDGTWTLKVEDKHTGETGTLNGWTLRLYGDEEAADDVYIYTNEYIWMGGDENAARRVLADDDGGVDTLNAAAVSYDSFIDLTGATVSVLATNDLTLANAAGIEKVFTGDGADHVVGNDADNMLDGGRGDDSLFGGTGNDVLRGGAGADILEGGSGNDSLLGGSGDDLLIGGAGADQFDGGEGFDTVSYESLENAVIVDLESGMASGGQADGDTLVSIEHVIGTAFDDTLIGSSGDDLFEGRGGADVILGGAGHDVVRFLGNIADYRITLAPGVATVTDLLGSDGMDTLTGIEELQFADTTVEVNLDINNAPAAAKDLLTIDEDTTAIIPLASLLANDVDLEGDLLTVTGVANAVNGTVSLDGQGNALFTPTANFFGPASFEYSIDDGHGNTATARVEITVNSVNDRPTTGADAYTAVEDYNLFVSSTSGSVLANDSDADGDRLTVSAFSRTSAQGGTVSMVESGLFNYRPAANFSGTDTFTYTASDGHGGETTQTVTVEVIPINDWPIGKDDLYSVNEDELLTVPATQGVLANEVDVDGDVLSVDQSWSYSEFGGTVTVAGDGSFTYRPPANFFGRDSFKYRANDGQGGYAIATAYIDVAPVNDSPWPTYEIYDMQEDGVLTVGAANGVLKNDRDVEGDALTVQSYQVTGQYGGTVTMNPDGSFTYRPAADFFGMDVFEYTVSDGHGGTATAQVGIRVAGVNDRPVAVEDHFTAWEDTVLAKGAADGVLANDFDADGNQLRVTSYSGTSDRGGTVTMMADGTLTYTPPAGYSGTDRFSYRISDGAGGEAQQYAVVTVLPVNDVPVARADRYQAIEDRALEIPVSLSVLANDTDADNDALSVIGFDAVTAQGGSVAMNADGTFRYVPALNFNGADSFTYTVSDGHGGTAVQTVTVEVAAVNDAPVVEAPAFVTAEDSPLVISVASLLSQASDVDGDSLSVTSVGLSQGGQVSLDGNGSVVFSPTADFNGSARFSYSVSDGRGATVTQTVQVTVSATPDRPVASPDTFTVQEDGILNAPMPVGVLANDHDPDGEAVSVVSYDQTTSHGGTVTMGSDGSFTYTPVANFNGMDSFSYSISDGTEQATQVVTINVASVNDTPATNPDVVQATEDVVIIIPVSTFLANDSDTDGDALTVTAVGNATHCTVLLQSGVVRITPEANFNGRALFQYTASDGKAGTSIGTVSVDVAPVNDAPVANDLSLSMMMEIPVAGRLPVSDADQDAATLAYSVIGQPSHGTFTVFSDGSYSYTPTVGFTGQDSVIYRSVDASGATDTGMVTINVTPRTTWVGTDLRVTASSSSFSSPAIGRLSTGGFVVVWSNSSLEYGLRFYDSAGQPLGDQVLFLARKSTYWALEITMLPDDSFYVTYNGNAVRHSASGSIIEPEFTYSGSGYRESRSIATLTNNDVAEAYVTSSDIYVRITGSRSLNFRVNDITTDTQDKPTIVAMQDGGFMVFWRSAANQGYSNITWDIWGRRFNADGSPRGAEFLVPGSTGASHGREHPDAAVLTDNALAVVWEQDWSQAWIRLFREVAPEGGSGDDILNGTGGIDTLSGNGGNDILFASGGDDTLIGGLGNDQLEGAAGVDVAKYFGKWRDYDRTRNGDGSTTIFDRLGRDGSDILVDVEIVRFSDATFRLDSNNAPEAFSDLLTTNEDHALRISSAAILSNDADFDGDTLTVSGVGNSLHGRVSIDDQLNIEFIPDDNFFGMASIEYTISDGNGGVGSGSVFIEVVAVSDNISVGSDLFYTREDEAINITTPQILQNDFEFDGYGLAVSAVESAIGGKVFWDQAGSLTFSPDKDFFGTASFKYRVADGIGRTAVADVFIDVSSVPDLPVAEDDHFMIDEEAVLRVRVADFLDNDTAVEGGVFVSGVGNAANGVVTLGDDGYISFTPLQDFFGVASFSYNVRDGLGGTATGSVQIDVNPINDSPDAEGDQVHAIEDVQLVIAASSLLANDRDADQEALAIVSVGGAIGGTVGMDEVGNVIFVPSPDFAGNASFEYSVADGYGAVSTATVTVDVAPVNDLPTTVDDILVTAEDTSLVISASLLLGNDGDAEGPLVIGGVGNAVGGTVSLDGDGNVTFTPDADFTGTASFAYTVSDSDGATATASVTVDVTPVNDAPASVADALATDEDVPLSVSAATLLGNDADVDGDALTLVSVDGATGGTVALDGDGNILFTPEADFSGAASFTYTVSDGLGAQSTATVTVAVTAVDDAPTAGADTAATAEDTAVVIPVATLLANDRDAEGAVSLASLGEARNGTVALDGLGNVVFTPAADFNGQASFDYRVADGTGNTVDATVAIDVAAVNDVPTGGADTLATAEDTLLVLAAEGGVLANDSDVDGDSLTVSAFDAASTSGGTVSLSSSGALLYNPAANFHGTDSFTYTVSDGKGGQALVAVEVTVGAVNDAPTAANDSFETEEDGNILVAAADGVLANDHDLDGDALSIVGHDAHSLRGGQVVMDGQGGFSYTPAPDFAGFDSFTYTVSDGHGGTSTATVTMKVAGGNDKPFAMPDAYSAMEDRKLTIAAANGVLANDSDADGDALKVTAFDLIGSAGGRLNMNPDGGFSYTPATDFHGTETFGYTIGDGADGISVGRIQIAVAGVNDAPVAGKDTYATDEGEALVVGVAGGVLVNDHDVDGDGLAVSSRSIASANGGSVAMNPDGSFTYAPPQGFAGIDTFTYAVSDGQGGLSTATVTVTVRAGIHAPEVVADAYSVDEDGVLAISAANGVLANDSDPDGDPLRVSDYDIITEQGGTVVMNPDGGFVYVPQSDFFGEDSFTYVVSDGTGGRASGTVSVTVHPVAEIEDASNQIIELYDDFYEGREDTALSISSAEGVIGSIARDVDGNSVSVVRFDAVSQAGGVVQMNPDGSFVYTPAPDFHGADSFTYTISNGRGAEASATVNISLASVNDLPVAGDDTAETLEDTAVVISAASLLANDADPEAGAVSIAQVGNAHGGAVALNVDGDVVFTPATDFVGEARFDYWAADAQGGRAKATVTVAVGAVNDAPVVVADAVAGSEDTPLLIVAGDLLANDLDADGDALQLVSVGAAVGGTVALDGEGNVLFTPEADFAGQASFEYTVSDGNGGLAGQIVLVEVAGTQDAPVAEADAFATREDLRLVLAAGDLLANDHDVDGDSLSIAAVGNGIGGTVSLDEVGNVVFRPDSNFNGTASFDYTVSDGHGGSATRTVTVEVSPENDAPVTAAEVLTTLEDTPIVLSPAELLANDSDVDGDVLTVEWIGNAKNGSLSTSLSGEVLFVPTADFFGSAFFDYRITDGHGGRRTQTVVVSVDSVNDAPIALADYRATFADRSLTISVAGLLANDRDKDIGDAVAFQGIDTTATHGTVAANPDGTITYDPGQYFVGLAAGEGDEDHFSYTVVDTFGAVSTATVTLVIAGVNDAPVVSGPVSHGVSEDGTLTIMAVELLANASDVDGDGLSVVNLAADQGALVDNGDGTWSLTPDGDWNGTVNLTYGVTDGTVTAAASGTVMVTPTDDVPIVSGPTSLSMAEDGTLTITAALLLANASDVDGDSLAIVGLTADQGSLTDNGDETWRLTPEGDWNGTINLAYKVTDGISLVDAGGTVTVSPVNDAPVLQAVSRTASAGRPFQFWQHELLDWAQATDLEGDALSITWVGNASGGQLSSSSYGPGLVRWTYNTDSTCSDGGFDFTVSDSQGGTASGHVGLAVNHSPLLPVQVFSGLEDVTMTISGSSLMAGTSDPDGDPLRLVGASGVEGCAVALREDGSVTFTPNADFYGRAWFNYVVTDGNAIKAQCAFVDVAPVNEFTPEAAEKLAWATEDMPVTVFMNTLLMGVTDRDGDTVTVTGAGNAVGGTVRLEGIGAQFLPDTNFNGIAGFDYVLSDGQGGLTTSHVTLNVRAVNDVPTVSAPVAFAMSKDETLTISATELLANASDVDGDGLSVVNLTADRGNLAYNGNGTWALAPEVDWWGTVNLSYGVTDGAATTATVASISVVPVDDTLAGGAGDDVLAGGGGADTYLFGRGSGIDTIDNRAEAGNGDRILFGADIGTEQLWFRQSGNNLRIDIIGTADGVAVKDWYASTANHVDRLEVADGSYLLDSQVENLVSAMAAFSPPPLGQTNLSAEQHQVLDTVIAANWERPA